MLPLASVQLVLGEPAHGALPMAQVVVPCTLVHVTRGVLPCTQAMTHVFYPAAIIERQTLHIKLDQTL